jgi:hypothetical protein
VVDPRNAKLLAGRIPGAQLVIFPELGHLLFWQEPDSFADVVTLFLLDDAKIKKSAGRRARNHGPRQASRCGPATLGETRHQARGCAENMAHTAFPSLLGVV